MGPIFEGRKIKLSLYLALSFIIVASPPVYRLVSSILSLEYDDEENNHRYSLLLIHSVVYLLIAFILVNVYDSVI